MLGTFQLLAVATQLLASATQLPALAYQPLPVTMQCLLTPQLVTALGHLYKWLIAATSMVLHCNPPNFPVIFAFLAILCSITCMYKPI